MHSSQQCCWQPTCTPCQNVTQTLERPATMMHNNNKHIIKKMRKSVTKINLRYNVYQEQPASTLYQSS